MSPQKNAIRAVNFTWKVRAGCDNGVSGLKQDQQMSVEETERSSDDDTPQGTPSIDPKVCLLVYLVTILRDFDEVLAEKAQRGAVRCCASRNDHFELRVWAC